VTEVPKDNPPFSLIINLSIATKFVQFWNKYVAEVALEISKVDICYIPLFAKR
jgi:hypothetical protein